MKAAICFGSLALVAEAARIQRRRADLQVAGVPLLNYPGIPSGLVEDRNHEEDWIVVVDPSTTDAQISAMCQRSSTHACAMVGHPSSGGVPFLEVRGTPKDLEHVLQGAAGMAKSVERNPRLNLIPDDDFGTVDGEEVGAASATWHLERIGVQKAARTGKGVHVYVFDTGVRTSHEDFEGRAVPTLDVVASPSSPLECKGDASCAGDVRGHGTHCAGTVGGRVWGVAKGSTVHAMKVLDDKGSAPWSYIIGGLDWLARRGARPAVASLSLGGPGQEAALEAAVGAVVAKGITVMVAAGNAGKDACDYTPARVPSAISVGALTKSNKVAFFSNYGSCTNIWAPGHPISSTSSKGNRAAEEKSGTSQACPQVAGGAAMLLEESPSLSPAQVRARLLSNAINGWIPKMKEGDVNKLLYVGAGGGGDLPPTPPPPAFFFR